MRNLALKTEENLLTVDNIHKASEFYDYETVLDKAFNIYSEVVEKLPKPFPVKLLPRIREDFNKHNTVVAVDEYNEIVGVAIIEELKKPQEAIGRFGRDAVKYCKSIYGYRKPIYELEAIAVKPDERQRGLGHAFYEAARKYTNNRCVAIVTEENMNGQKTAIAGGFSKVPDSLFEAPFSVENGVAKLDVVNGKHIVKANLYSSKEKLDIAFSAYPIMGYMF